MGSTASTWSSDVGGSRRLSVVRRVLVIGFIRDVVITGGSQTLQAVFAMAGGILVARLLGPAGKGTLSVLVTLGAMAVSLGALGLHTSGIYFLGRYKHQRPQIAANLIAVGVGGGAATAAVLAAVVTVFRDDALHGVRLTYFLVYLAAVPCSYFNAFARRLALGAGRVVVYNLPDLIEGIGLFLGTVVLFVTAGRQLMPFVILRVALELGIAVILARNVWRLVGAKFRVSGSLLRRQVRYGMRNYGSSLLWLLLLQSDVVLCNHFLGAAPTGIYSVAVSLGMPVTVVGAAVGTITFQRVASARDRRERVENTNRTIRLLAPILVIVVASVGFLAIWLVPFVYGSQYDAAVLALALLLPGLLFLALETVLMNFLSGEGSPSIIYRAPLLGLLINGIANMFVIPRWGIDGASLTSTISYLIVFLVILVYYLKWTNSRLLAVAVPRRADLDLLRASYAAPTDGMV